MPSTPNENHQKTPASSESSRSSVSLGDRLKSPRTLVSFALAAAFIIFVFRNLDLNVSEIADNIASGNPFWIGLGFLAYYGAFPIRSWRWRKLMESAGIYKRGEHLPVYSIGSLSEIFVLSWFANCLVPAKLGDAYRGYLLRARAGVSFASTLGTIVAERFIDVFALVGLMVAAALLTFHGDVPEDVQLPLVGGGVLVLVGLVGLAFVARYRSALLKLVPERFSAPVDRLQGGVLSSFARQGWVPVTAATAVIWATEGLRVYCVAAAFDVQLSAPEAIFVALLASLLTVIPLTPAGLGVVESGTIIALKLLDVTDTDAATIALVDRGIAYWSVIVVGAVLWIVVRRRG
ncbi:MAG: lysylphosphatidylglycerol synthase transmembrane domain-containing protein [Thermomicrobiales bacterium]